MRFWNTAVPINEDNSGIKCPRLVPQEETILEEVGRMQAYQNGILEEVEMNT
jgi:hypothetical protein